MKKKHFKQTNNRPIVFLQLFLATQTFFIFALLTNIEHHWDTKRLLSVNKRKQRNWKKKSLDLLLHERCSFFLCSPVLFSTISITDVLYKILLLQNEKILSFYEETYLVSKNRLCRENQNFHPFVLRFLAFLDTVVTTFKIVYFCCRKKMGTQKNFFYGSMFTRKGLYFKFIS